MIASIELSVVGECVIASIELSVVGECVIALN